MVSRPSPARAHSIIRNASTGPSMSARNTSRGVSGRPSRLRAASMMKKRAKWTLGSLPNGTSELLAESWPAVSSSERSWPSWPARISAITGTAVWVVTIGQRQGASRADGRACVRELKREVDGFGFADEDDAQITARADLADLIAHRASDQRRLRIVEDDGRLGIEPARRDVNARSDQVPAQRADLVQQRRARTVDNFAAPR